MKKRIDVVRAWRDEEYRNSLTEEERASLPENPAGLAMISDQTLRSIAGGCAMSKYCGECSNWMCSCITPPEICP